VNKKEEPKDKIEEEKKSEQKPSDTQEPQNVTDTISKQEEKDVKKRNEV